MSNQTVNVMKQELYALIINELERQARPHIKYLMGNQYLEVFRAFVRTQYLVLGGPLNRELCPYFVSDQKPDLHSHTKMVEADLEVLVEIADKLGYKVELNWKRR